MKTIFPRSTSPPEDPLALLARCGGFYECPKNTNGKRLGPLVGCAGRDKQNRQFVGDVYANFAKAEHHASLLDRFAVALMATAPHLFASANFCGAPEGGKALATALAIHAGGKYIFPEKKVTAVTTSSSREISELVFDRHEPGKDEAWWIVEDVCNNFSTTAKLATLIEAFNARVAGIVCFLNRSLEVHSAYTPRPGLDLPVVALVRKPIIQYSQDDPEVAADIQAGNVVWKPKNEWGKLEAAMREHQPV